MGHSLFPIFLLAVVALWTIQPANAQERLRVGLSSVSATQGAMWVAEERGLFKKYGIDPEVIIIGGGASRVVSSLLAGEIQFSVGGGDAVIRAALKGADTVLAVSPLKTARDSLPQRFGTRTFPTMNKSKSISPVSSSRVFVFRMHSDTEW